MNSSQRPNHLGGGYPPQGYPSHGQPFPQRRPPQKKSSSSNIWIIVTVLGAILFVGMCAIGGVVLYLAGQLASDSAEMRTLTSRDGISEIQVPKNWSSTMQLNSDATTQAGSHFSENYVIVITEPKSDLPGYDLNAFTQLVKENMQQTIPSLGAAMPVQTTINGRSAMKFQGRGTVDGNQVVIWITTVSGQTHYHQVMTWTLASRESKNGDVLRAVTNSFRETR